MSMDFGVQPVPETSAQHPKNRLPIVKKVREAPPERYIIQDHRDLPQLSAWDTIIIDTETSGFHPHHGDRTTGIVVGRADRPEAYYVPLRHPTRGQYTNIRIDKTIEWLKFYAESTAYTWVMHNAKYDLGMLRKEGIEVRGKIYDTMVAAHVVRGDLFQYSLDNCTSFFLNGNFAHPWYLKLKEWFAQNQTKAKNDEGALEYDYSKAGIELLGNYGMEDIEATRQIYRHFEDEVYCWAERLPNKDLLAWGQRELLANEMKLVRVIFEMEWNGMKVNQQRTQELYDRTMDELYCYQQQLFHLVGHSFNINSWKQIWEAFERVGGRILFWNRPEIKNQHEYPHLERWEFKGKQKLEQFTMDKSKSTGRPCWNSVAIMKYLEGFKKANNMAAYHFVLWYREFTVRNKIASTYLAAYMKQADVRGRIHASFNPTGARTGRFSCSNPNLQNQSKSKGNADMKALLALMEEHDEAFTGTVGKELRGLFEAEEGNALVSIDFSGQEYRWATYFAQDEDMLAKYAANDRLNYHQETADMVGLDYDVSKTVNFGTLYGMQGRGLASSLTGIGKPTTPPEGYAILDRVFEKRPRLKQLLRSVGEVVEEKGAIQTVYGRVTPVEKSRPYTGINYLVQGTSADQMRDALVRVYEFIQSEPRYAAVKIIATVHDEILFEMPMALVEEVAPKLSQIMCLCPFADIPFVSDIEVGKTWGKQKSLEEWLQDYKAGVAA